ncbi:Uma2 family endonuclease [Labilithrix luteola]|uniref:Uma2 family endonuclease n=1 Tax=Labilithrix luteola TaxID=1391654 RepID=UPI001F0A59D6|nr:Uma2 family endonuclease [Labilithrix luteola]
MSTVRRLHYSYEEYVRALEMSELRLEYQEGVIYAMPGGTPAHAQLGATMIGLFYSRLPRTCRTATSDMKVRVEATDLSTFPDVSVVCGEAKSSSIDANAITNPTLLVEVTSRSTEDYDRGDKLSQYKQVPSLRAVVFVSPRSHRLTVVERTATGWDERDYRSGEIMKLGAPAIDIAVDDAYEGIALDPQ